MYTCQRVECEQVGYIHPSNINNNNSQSLLRRNSVSGPVQCEHCNSFYCSEQCKQLDKDPHRTTRQCIHYVQADAKQVLSLLGYQSDNPEESYELFVIAGEHFFGFPGPVTGPIPKKLIPIRDAKYFNLLNTTEKEMLLNTSYHYVVWSKHLPCVWKELTKEQKEQMEAMINQSSTMIALALTSLDSNK
jgi:hypothetical protein